MVTFTLKIKNRPAEVNLWFAEYPGHYQYMREGDFSPIELTGVPESGTLIVTIFSSVTAYRDEIRLTGEFGDGAIYICDFATHEIRKEGIAERASLRWLLLVALAIVVVVILVKPAEA